MIYLTVACLGPAFLIWSLWLIQEESMNKSRVKIKVRNNQSKY